MYVAVLSPRSQPLPRLSEIHFQYKPRLGTMAYETPVKNKQRNSHICLKNQFGRSSTQILAWGINSSIAQICSSTVHATPKLNIFVYNKQAASALSVHFLLTTQCNSCMNLRLIHPSAVLGSTLELGSPNHRFPAVSAVTKAEK